MLRLVESFSLAGDPAKPNEDAFGGSEHAALVMDGATMLGDGLMPGPSDAAWIAQFGARRLIAHLKDEEPKKALKRALGDAEKSFLALRRAPLEEPWQLPCASMILAAEHEKGLEFLYLGDCGALVEQPDGGLKIVGETLDKRAAEAARAAQIAKDKNLAPASGLRQPEFLRMLRAARNRVNSGDYWLFSPDTRAAAHAQRRIVALEPGAHLLLASDGFLALASDYGAYDAAGLLAAAKAKGLKALGDELRAIEDADALGEKFARFKKSDDATALLLEVV
jgi:hypothetical protein